MSQPENPWTERARIALAASLRAAASVFTEAGQGGAHAVHDARKEFKRTAALARWLAPILGAAAYDALDAAGAARRAFGRARDLDILPLALDRVKCAPETRETLRRAIALARGEGRAAEPGLAAPDHADRLAAAASAVEAGKLHAASDEMLLTTLRWTYRSAKKLGRAAFSSGDADDLHDLRAHVVDLGLQLAVLRPVWPAMIDAACEELHKLRQTLGDFNDLTVLGEFALAQKDLTSGEAEDFVAAVTRRRRPLERRARAQFERAFAERPGAFAKRIAAYVAHPQGKG